MNRRTLLTAAAGLGAALSLKPAAAAQNETLEALTEKLRLAMTSRHGGTWQANIDPCGKFVMMFEE